ncbi:unnamed protein product, partial [Meganyctiphanes norvegica]
MLSLLQGSENMLSKGSKLVQDLNDDTTAHGLVNSNNEVSTAMVHDIQQEFKNRIMGLPGNDTLFTEGAEELSLAVLRTNYSEDEGVELHTQGLPNMSILANDSMQSTANSSMPIDMIFNSSHVLQISCYTVIFVVSLVGNLCVLKAILGGGRKQRKSRVNLMLLHLALADLIVTVVMIPVEVGWAATVQWTAGDTSCRVFSFFRIFGHYLSSFILVCISIDRYFAVVHPLSLNAADRRGKIMLCFAWFLAFTCALPQFIIFAVKRHNSFVFFRENLVFPFKQNLGKVYNLFCLIMLYLAPLTIIIIFYGAIVITIFQKSRLSADESMIRRSSLGYLGRARARTIKMTISIVGAFFICWTPYIVISLWFCFDRNSAEKLDQMVLKFLFIFACTNSCANPIVYGIFNFCRKKQPKVRVLKVPILDNLVA